MIQNKRTKQKRDNTTLIRTDTNTNKKKPNTVMVFILDAK